jgi:thymidylate kinase
MLNPNGKLKHIVLEGGPGNGKTIQADILIDLFKEINQKVRTHEYAEPSKFDENYFSNVKEKSDVASAENILTQVFHKLIRNYSTVSEVSPFTEAHFYYIDRAAKAPLLKKRIADGEVVIQQRNYLSTIVYQGGSEYPKMSFQDIVNIHKHFEDHICIPDLSIIIDVDPKVAYARRSSSTDADKFEKKINQFNSRFAEYALLGRILPDHKLVVVDGNTPENLPEKESIKIVSDRLVDVINSWDPTYSNFTRITEQNQPKSLHQNYSLFYINK